MRTSAPFQKFLKQFRRESSTRIDDRRLCKLTCMNPIQVSLRSSIIAALTSKLHQKLLKWSTSILLLFAGFNLAACYKNHFNVQQEWIDRNFLASSHIRTPDPRQERPPVGQRLLVSWDFPRSIFEKHLLLCLTVRFWDDTQETISQPIERKRDFATFFFPQDSGSKDKRILTYRVQAISEKGEIVGAWDHQFWTKLIDVGKDNFSSAQRINSSVSSQERQGSVIDLP